MKYRTFRTEEFDDWLEGETLKSQVQIESRISKIEIEGHFGLTRYVNDEVHELKWKDGRRVYFTILQKKKHASSIRRK